MSLLALGGSDCEALHDGLLGQPANSMSSLAYVVVAAYVLHRGAPPAPALALALVGVGSVLYHGPMPPGAGPSSSSRNRSTLTGRGSRPSPARRWTDWSSATVSRC